MRHNPSDLSAAYEILLEALDSEIEWVNALGAAAFQEGDRRRVAAINDRARTLDALHAELVAFGTRLRQATYATSPRPQAKGGKLARGLKTPQHAYRVPILTVLVESGGSADINHILRRVYDAMSGQFNEHDLAPLASHPDIPRWHNTAQWTRNSMRVEGLLAADSPRGLWEITDAGRAWLAEHADTRTMPPDGETPGSKST